MSNDLWRTPPEVFSTLNKEFCFVADMAASAEDKKCPIYFCEAIDSTKLEWAKMLSEHNETGTSYVWVNPPYSKPMPWVKKAIEAQANGLGVVMLLNADTSVSWFTEASKYVSEVRFIIGDKKESGGYSIGRISFLDGKGKAGIANNKPQFVLIFNPFKIGAMVTSYVTKKELYGLK